MGIPIPGAPSQASPNPDDNDLFFLELKYEDPYQGLDVPAAVRKSGEASQVWWRTRGRNREGFGLLYDYLGRQTKAGHVRLDNNNGARVINTYAEDLQYADPRGNISRIQRYGLNFQAQNNSGAGIIDDLQFTLLSGSNRIQRVNEQALDNALKMKGFRPKTEANGSTSTTGIDYTYDANGNLTSDPHKGISSINYNYLNLPQLITYSNGRTIEQRYDAQGNLLVRLVNDPNDPSASYMQTYVYGTEFRGGSLESVAHQEGRLFVTGSLGSGNYAYRTEYHITDHLGNTRLTFTDKIADGIIKLSDGEVLEESHYYPFGLAMDGPWLNDLTARDNRYKFNGIERVPDFGLNMDLASFRSYDPAIGRWWQADPIAKAWESPYAAMFNSPLNWADGMGDNPGSPGIQGPRAVAQDSTPRTVWNFLTVPKIPYEESDRFNIPGMANGQFGTKVAANTVVELWNGAVGLAYGVTHPKQAWKGISNAGSYLWNSSLDQKLTDLGDVAYNSPETIVSLAVPLGATSKIGKLGSLTSKLGKIGRMPKFTLGKGIMSNAGELLAKFDIPKYYTYATRGKRFFVTPHAMKHLEELAANGAKLGPDYMRLIGQTHLRALNAAIDDVVKRGPIQYRKMYHAGGHEIMFGAPRAAGHLPAVIHFR